jgi:hypothetical protein
VKIESPANFNFTFGIAVISITLFAWFMSVSAFSVVQSEQIYKIDNVKHVEKFDDIDNREKIDETYKLSETELTDKQKQKIMEQKDVTTENEIHEDASLYYSSQVALKDDSGSYIADVKYIYQNLPWIGLIMVLVSFILFFCMCAVHSKIDDGISSSRSLIALNYFSLTVSSIFLLSLLIDCTALYYS